jgi:hypothetical protein
MRPSYLRRTFLELGDGLRFSSPPPPDVGDLRHLASEDPWRVLPCALTNLQQGQFAVTRRLVVLLHETRDAEVWDACALLLSFAAPYSVLRRLVASFDKLLQPKRSDYTRRYFCEILASAAGVWSVPHLLRLYREMEDREVKGMVQTYLSQVLEAQPGPIWKGPRVEWQSNELPPPFEESTQVYEDAEYLARVEETFGRVVSEQGLRDQDAVQEGGRLDIRDMARRLLGRVRTGEFPDRIETGRMFLEATTGLDCRQFFDDAGRLRRLAAAAIIEEFLARGKADQYTPGVRYFFRHRIPE